MSREFITAQPEDDIAAAMRLMTRHRVRHVPVVHRDQLHGIHLMRSYIEGAGNAVVTPMA
jgi:CBS domain-containing protein